MNEPIIVAWQARDGFHRWQECENQHIAELALENAKADGAQQNVWVFEVSQSHKGADAASWVQGWNHTNA
ncbi:hypothetical protein EDM56_20440 [Brevibacillus fluminis]|uniref:Uncharacterized protein n=1 Tax=Brevibacillus fluminis TaxID=511487 RepID=A0A3M8D8Y5_9BACL|nr:hypothetical protein [Brevibacillus fluminis]RNB84486.1 hypothetical protein EDM56_20440 [Brevibacillus fluminis]